MKGKTILFVILAMLSVLVLGACKDTSSSDNWAVLPDLNGQTEEELSTVLDGLGIQYEIKYYEEAIDGYDFLFIMYDGYNIGQVVNGDELITVIVYPEYVYENYVELPDLDSLSRSDIVTLFVDSMISYYFIEVDTTVESEDGLFIAYDGTYQAGDQFNTTSAIGIRVYKYHGQVSTEYFQVLDLEYDGPYLDDSYASIDYMNPRGGYFEVTLRSCTDGDTAKFNYPTDIYDAIQSGAKSTRFLNMDTEETYTGGEEEWGKPGSLYTCSILDDAESIILQTDPGDGLLDTHGRLLAWIWVQLPGEEEYFLLNYMVVKQGLAQVKYEFGAGLELSYGDYTYNEWMHIAQDYAIDNELGQWGNLLDYYWNYDLDEPYYERWNAN